MSYYLHITLCAAECEQPDIRKNKRVISYILYNILLTFSSSFDERRSYSNRQEKHVMFVCVFAGCRSPGSCGHCSVGWNQCKSAPTASSVPSCFSSSCSSSSSSPSPPASGAWASCSAPSCSCCTSFSWWSASCWRTRSLPVRCPSEDLWGRTFSPSTPLQPSVASAITLWPLRSVTPRIKEKRGELHKRIYIKMTKYGWWQWAVKPSRLVSHLIWVDFYLIWLLNWKVMGVMGVSAKYRNIMHALSVIRWAAIKTTPGRLENDSTYKLLGGKCTIWNSLTINAVTELKLWENMN